MISSGVIPSMFEASTLHFACSISNVMQAMSPINAAEWSGVFLKSSRWSKPTKFWTRRSLNL